MLFSVLKRAINNSHLSFMPSNKSEQKLLEKILISCITVKTGCLKINYREFKKFSIEERNKALSHFSWFLSGKHFSEYNADKARIFLEKDAKEYMSLSLPNKLLISKNTKKEVELRLDCYYKREKSMEIELDKSKSIEFDDIFVGNLDVFTPSTKCCIRYPSAFAYSNTIEFVLPEVVYSSRIIARHQSDEAFSFCDPKFKLLLLFRPPRKLNIFI
ncbi:hypothetical protein SteCoe_19355 [Stentor coeruleus]|uniref:Uncharacterized protein n=1 Tax=Stentor coeruleus TaxID=5963 RepID=A0A1R2BUN3_9CILI|nr:hypothetical protein SteCoe_19355 [Stentor coeruleus]